MHYRQLGKTGLSASVIGLGGEWFVNKSQAEVTAVMEAALAGGVNMFDCFMPQPETRTHIGQALRGRREQMIIQGHLCAVFENGQYERSRDMHKVKAAFTDLLARLNTTYIDIGMIHYVDSMDDLAEVCEGGILDYARQLQQAGVIRHLGISSHNPLVARKAVEMGVFEVLMFSINAAYDLEKPETDIYAQIAFADLTGEHATATWSITPERQALYAACQQAGVGITVMKALGAGSLLSAERSPFGQAMSVAQCCHYCLTRPGVASVLVGCATPAEMQTAIAYCEASDAERDYAPVLGANPNVQMSGRCMYCNHCQPCPQRIDIAEVTKYLDLALLHDHVPDTVRQHYAALGVTAADCIECGVCEPNCPFGVRVRENMRRAQEVFGNA